MEKITLDTDYKATGHITGMPIDTLAIAVYGNDSSGFADYEFQMQDEAVKYVLDNFNYESAFIASLNKEQAKALMDDAIAYAEALAEYKQKTKQAVYDDMLEYSHPLAKEVEKAKDDSADEFYEQFVYGDYYSFDGVIPLAQQKYGIAIEYRNHELYAEVTQDKLAELLDDEVITSEKHTTKALEYIVENINADAQAQHRKNMAETEERRAQWQKRKETEEKVAKAKEEERRRKLAERIQVA